MRAIWIALGVLAAIGCGSAKGPTRASRPADGDPSEWGLLHDVATGSSSGLGRLADYYQQRAAWDEYSAVRSRMLESADPSSVPAPGGPFPRIGVVAGRRSEATVLSRWLNPSDLPELFQAKQIGQRELEARLRALPQSATSDTRLADLLCSELRFPEAAQLYRQALAAQPGDAAATRARLDDVQRILEGR